MIETSSRGSCKTRLEGGLCGLEKLNLGFADCLFSVRMILEALRDPMQLYRCPLRGVDSPKHEAPLFPELQQPSASISAFVLYPTSFIGASPAQRDVRKYLTLCYIRSCLVTLVSSKICY